MLLFCSHVSLDFNWILFIFGHNSGPATGDGSRNATRHTMTNVDIQMTPLGAEDAGSGRWGVESGRPPLVALLSQLWPKPKLRVATARSERHPQLAFQSIVGHVAGCLWSTLVVVG